MTSHHKTGTHPFLWQAGIRPALIHFYDKPASYRYSSILHRYVYTHIYTYLCTYIYFPEGMFTYFFHLVNLVVHGRLLCFACWVKIVHLHQLLVPSQQFSANLPLSVVHHRGSKKGDPAAYRPHLAKVHRLHGPKTGSPIWATNHGKNQHSWDRLAGLGKPVWNTTPK